MKKIALIILVAIAVWLLPQLKGTPASASPSFKATRTGKASWYSRLSPGIKKTTANNERFNDRDLTCAIWGVGFNRKIKVTNLSNGKSVVVRVNDRGPHQRYIRKGRVIDLTFEA